MFYIIKNKCLNKNSKAISFEVFELCHNNFYKYNTIFNRKSMHNIYYIFINKKKESKYNLLETSDYLCQAIKEVWHIFDKKTLIRQFLRIASLRPLIFKK